jgi:pimeloyl-ACP methyl ester carboxylesterase
MASIEANGINLEYEIDGDDDGAPLLLVSGLGGQLVGWDPEFVQGLADRGFRVIRFDNRDVGRSTWFDDTDIDVATAIMGVLAGEKVDAPYHLGDMAADAAALLDGLGVERAHVLGVSMGGMIAQQLAIDHPGKVITLTSIMSTTGDSDVGHPRPEVLGTLLTPAPSEPAAAIEAAVETFRIIGSPEAFDEARTRARAEREVSRALHPAGTARQLLGIMTSPARSDALRHLTIDALVIHGDADPLVDVSGGRRTAEVILGAELMVLDGMGHDLPALYWPPIFEAVTALAARNG